MNEKVAFVTLGCKLNYAETSTYERGLVATGMQVVPWNDPEADIYVVNTCTVTEHSDKKCRNIIRKLHRVSPEADIFVTGCCAQLHKDALGRMDGVRRVFGTDEKGMVVTAIAAHAAGSCCAAGVHESFFPAYSSGERTRAFLKVQDGCDFKCSYCTVPYARGGSRNGPIAELVSAAREIAASGVKEIVLTGVNTGDFGKSTGESFLGLIQALEKVEGIERYRISSIEPNLLTEEIVDWIASGTKFLPHFHIPLQSGSDAVLHEMGRRYDTESFAGKIAYIRNRMEIPGGPRVFFGIDVIAGFPGETDGLFEETLTFLEERIRPAFIHVFPYSRRAGTPAAGRKDQVRDAVKTERVRRLEILSERLHGDFVRSHKGMTAGVLFESTGKRGSMFGYTENYIRVERPYDAASINRIVQTVF